MKKFGTSNNANRLHRFARPARGRVPAALGIADIFAKVGVIAWDASISGQIDDVTERQSEDGTDPAYGIGIQFRIKSFAIRAEFEYFDIEGAKYVYMYSLGGSYTF